MGRGSGRHDQLRHTIVVRQIDKQNTAVVAPVSQPAGQPHLRVKMACSQFSACMSSVSMHSSRHNFPMNSSSLIFRCSLVAMSLKTIIPSFPSFPDTSLCTHSSGGRIRRYFELLLRSTRVSPSPAYPEQGLAAESWHLPSKGLRRRQWSTRQRRRYSEAWHASRSNNGTRPCNHAA